MIKFGFLSNPDKFKLHLACSTAPCLTQSVCRPTNCTELSCSVSLTTFSPNRGKKSNAECFNSKPAVAVCLKKNSKQLVFKIKETSFSTNLMLAI